MGSEMCIRDRCDVPEQDRLAAAALLPAGNGERPANGAGSAGHRRAAGRLCRCHAALPVSARREQLGNFTERIAHLLPAREQTVEDGRICLRGAVQQYNRPRMNSF